MYQNNFLEKFSTCVEQDGEKYIVHYKDGDYTGTCTYTKLKMTGQNKPIIQECLILTETNMLDVIESQYKEGTVSSEDVTPMSLYIRVHSLKRVEDYIKEKTLSLPS